MALDWDDLRFFVFAARSGSLSQAAARLGVSVATVGRRLERLELTLGQKLFHRSAQGLLPTPEAEALLEQARGVEERVTDLLRAADASGAEQSSGVVTVSTIESLVTHVVAPSLGQFRQAHPDVNVVLRSEWRQVRLSDRSADIALRVVRPDEERIVVRKVASIRFGLFASADYVARRGRPSDPENDLENHDLVAYNAHFDAIPEVAWYHVRDASHQLRVRLPSAAAILAAIKGGAGIGLLPVMMASPELVCITDETSVPRRDVWLAVHEDLRHVPRVRAVVDHLAAICRTRMGAPQ